MAENKELTFLLRDSDEVPAYLTLILEEYNYSHDAIVRYTFLLEEALLEWKSVLPGDTKLTLTRRNAGINTVFDLSAPGEKIDAFRSASAPGSDGSAAPLERMHELLLSGIGSEFHTSYKKGRNHIRGIFPRKNAERRLTNRSFLLLMIPIVLQTLLNSIASYADAFMLSFYDADAMSAVSLTTQFSLIFNLLMVAVTGASTALIAQLWGKREHEKINSVAGVSLKIALIIAVIFSALSALFPSQIISLLTDVENVRAYGTSYIRLIFPTFIFNAVFTVVFGCFRIMGEARTSLKIGIAGCIINLILNAVLIFGLFGVPSLGIAGAAIATLASQVYQCVACLIYNSRKKVLHFDILHFSAGKDSLCAFFRQFFPIASQCMIWEGANLIIVSAYGHLGADILAAFSILNLLEAVMQSVKNSIGSAGGVIVGASLGRGNFDEAGRKSAYTFRITALIGLICALVYFACCTGLRFLPMDLSENSKYALSFMAIVYAVNLFFAGMNGIIIQGALQIGGDARAVLVIDTICMWGIMVPLAVLGTYVFKVPALVMALLLKSDEIVSFPLKFMRYRQKKWLRKL